MIGLGAIEDYLLLMPGGMTLHYWRIWYPDLAAIVKKENGQFIAFTADLAAWQAAHLDVAENLDDIFQPREIIQTRVVKTRFGFSQIQHRKIIT